mgnify:FL=1|jgi:hypothetical protein
MKTVGLRTGRAENESLSGLDVLHVPAMLEVQLY